MRELGHLHYSVRHKIRTEARELRHRSQRYASIIPFINVILLLGMLFLQIAWSLERLPGHLFLTLYYAVFAIFLTTSTILIVRLRRDVRSSTKLAMQQRRITPKYCFVCRYCLENLPSPSNCPECGELLVTYGPPAREEIDDQKLNQSQMRVKTTRNNARR